MKEIIFVWFQDSLFMQNFQS